MTKRHQLSLRIVAPLALGALLLSGCDDSSGKTGESESPSPSVSSTTTSSPTVTTSPTDAPTETPDNPLGPEETIREFVRVQNKMDADGDTAAFLAMSQNCDYCSKTAKRVSDIYKNGGYIRTEGWTVASMELSRKLGQRRSYWVTVEEAPIEFRERRGGELKKFDGGARKWLFGLIRVGENWKITYGGIDK